MQGRAGGDIPEDRRREIFLALVDAQDHEVGVTPPGVHARHKVTAKGFGGKGPPAGAGPPPLPAEALSPVVGRRARRGVHSTATAAENPDVLTPWSVAVAVITSPRWTDGVASPLRKATVLLRSISTRMKPR